MIKSQQHGKNKKKQNYSRVIKEKIVLSSKALIPTSIKNYIDTCIEAKAPKFKYSFKIEFLYYIVFTLIRRQDTYENKELENIPIALNAIILKSIKSDYNEYLDWLINHNIILLAQEYSVGKSSRKYMFSESIMNLLTENYASQVVEMNELKSNKIIIAESITNMPVYEDNKHLLKFFNDKLEIDYDKAMIYLDDLCFYEGEIFDLKYKKTHWYRQIFSLHNKVFHATRNEESDFRLHTNLTNFSKRFKPFITYDKQQLIGFDLKNSQPFFLIYLIESIMESNPKVDGILTEVYKNDYNNDIIPRLKVIISQEEFKNEYQDIKEWVLKGELYENISKVITPQVNLGAYNTYKFCKRKKITKKVRCYDTRTLAKSVFLSLLFRSVNTKDKYYHQVKNAYPNFVGFIEVFKKKDNSNFSRVLQNIESECFIDFVTVKIAELFLKCLYLQFTIQFQLQKIIVEF